MTSTLDQRLAKVALALCRAVGGRVAGEVSEKILTGDTLGLVSMTIDPRNYSNALDFKWDYACVELLRKLPIDIPGVDRESKARESFADSERRCYRTNCRLDPLLNNYFGSGDEYLVQFLDKARGWIRDVLGKVPRDLDGKFGPGSTYGDKGSLNTIPDKMSSRPTVTESARDLLPLVMTNAWMRSLLQEHRESDPETVRGNRFTTVPKDALKVRGICIEPSVNIFLQLSVGALMKRRLRLAGIDLVYGQDLHRQWAERASRNGLQATIDLSNASDTVAFRLVELLLPTEWFDLLCSLRSPFTRVDGKWHKLEKFSSMGNGFTFELETLIFSAICFACGSGVPGVDFHVFGDDIIVNQDVARSVVSALSFFGFTTNARKTFLDGPFRESCGADFFDGVPVRAHYVKEDPAEPQQWISLANGLRRMVQEDHIGAFHNSRVFAAWQRCIDCLPSSIRRLRGPKELGDLVIHDDRFSRRWRSGVGYVQVFRPVHNRLAWHHWKPSVILAAALYGMPSEGVIPRDGVSGHKVGWVPFS